MQCPGCSGEFPDTAGPTHEYILSAPACWAAYGQVLAREYSTPTLMRLHKLTVDTYAVQHPGVDVPPARRSVAIHLSRLYLFLERKMPIEQVDAAMPRILAQKEHFGWLEPPSMEGTLTVLSLREASPIDPRPRFGPGPAPFTRHGHRTTLLSANTSPALPHRLTRMTRASSNVLVIMGSVRAGRLNPKIAAWVIEVAKAASDLNHELSYELIDLNDWPLPMTDEPGIPQRGKYEQPHTIAWSEKIASADAFVFVSPQYNWGYPAPLKNAIDHLFQEWKSKPAVIVTYGGHGGGKCAAQLRQVLEAIGVVVVPTMPALTITRDMMMGAPVDPETSFAPHKDDVVTAIGELSDALSKPQE